MTKQKLTAKEREFAQEKEEHAKTKKELAEANAYRVTVKQALAKAVETVRPLSSL